MTLPDYDDLKRLDFLTKLHALLDEHKSYIDVESFLNTRYFNVWHNGICTTIKGDYLDTFRVKEK